tara:strand:- start:64 stop:291 length:228 start_codon:yes stop_codon:yes gene_type:complete
MRLKTNSNIADYVTDKKDRDHNKLNFINLEDLDSDLKCCGYNNPIAVSGGGKSVMFSHFSVDEFTKLMSLDGFKE